jgi:uncharacterized protein (DUF2147 family)
MLKLMRLGLFAAALTAAFPLASALAEVGRPYGNWSMGKVTIKVKDCGGGLCGTIVALKEPISKIDGKPKVDRKNSDFAKRKRPLFGLAVLIGMNPAGAGKWQGAIYNPNDGNTCSASIKVVGNTLKVKAASAAFCARPTTLYASIRTNCRHHFPSSAGLTSNLLPYRCDE